jgi:hypothetical protein
MLRETSGLGGRDPGHGRLEKGYMSAVGKSTHVR